MFTPGEKDHSGSVGTLLPGIELKLINHGAGRLDTDAVIGEAFVRSPSVFTGYLDRPDASVAAFDCDGFCRTGDRVRVVGIMLHIDGRIKDIMKVNGWQVSPTEIENVLLEHPEVADVAVVGITSVNEQGLAITRPRAFVVKERSFDPQSKPQLSDKDLESIVAARLVSYKRISGGVVFVDYIPRNPTGKILRGMLLGERTHGEVFQ